MPTTEAGEAKAWGLLAASDPAEVCARAGVDFAPESGAFRLTAFGQRFSVSPGERLIRSLGPGGEALLDRHGWLFRLSALWYLVKASGASPRGTLVKPSRLSGGEIFLKGTHVLPLDALAAGYATRPEAFLAAGVALGGRPAPYGDAAIELPALPKVPATVILWTADEQFPARADLLVDATAPHHLPLDILWSVAMLSVQLLLEPAHAQDT